MPTDYKEKMLRYRILYYSNKIFLSLWHSCATDTLWENRDDDIALTYLKSREVFPRSLFLWVLNGLGTPRSYTPRDHVWYSRLWFHWKKSGAKMAPLWSCFGKGFHFLNFEWSHFFFNNGGHPMDMKTAPLFSFSVPSLFLPLWTCCSISNFQFQFLHPYSSRTWE